MKKRLLAMLLTLCMVLTLLPATALAVEEQTVGQTPVVCDQLDGCTAETHREGCPLYVVPKTEPEQPAKPTACTVTEGCTLLDGHEGDCAVPDSSAPAPAESSVTPSADEPPLGTVRTLTASTLEVTVQEAGTLQATVEATEGYSQDSVTSLTIITEPGAFLNFADFTYMREQLNHLSYLDLTDADCVNDADPGNPIEHCIPTQAMGTWGGGTYAMSLETVILSRKITAIGGGAFSACANLSGELFIPANIKELGSWSFQQTGYTSVVFEEGSQLETIWNGVFASMSKLEKADIPEGVTYIGDYAFEACDSFAGNTGDGTLTLPDSVKSIGRSFYALKKLTKLNLGNGIEAIGSDAFGACTNLTGALTIPDSVTTIGYRAFLTCTGLTGALTIPGSVTSIGDYAFRGCAGLNGDLTIGNNVKTIGNYAFYDCTGLTGSLTIPDSVTSIGVSAFQGCAGLNGDLTIGNNVETIGNNAFYNCTGLTGSLTIPDSVTSIGVSAFQSCTGLTGNLTVPDSVTSIGTAAFHSCSGLTGTLTIPDSVTSIGNSAFQSCTGFTGALTIPNGVISIGDGAFQFCSGFNSIFTIPDSVTSIGRLAFYGCTGLTGDITLPAGLKTLGVTAFHNTAITGLAYHGAMITDLGSNSYFETLSALQTLDFSGSELTKLTWTATAPKLTTVLLPDTLTELTLTNKRALEDIDLTGCTGLTSVNLSNNAIDFSDGKPKEWLTSYEGTKTITGQNIILYATQGPATQSVEQNGTFADAYNIKTKNGTDLSTSEKWAAFRAANQQGVAESDGWITVNRLSATHPITRTPATVNTATAGVQSISYSTNNPMLLDLNYGVQLTVGEVGEPSGEASITIKNGTNTIGQSGLTKTYGNTAFALRAELTNLSGAVTWKVYEDNSGSAGSAVSNAVLEVSDAGQVTIKGAGTAWVTASVGDTTSDAVKIIVNRATYNVSLTSARSKTYGYADAANFSNSVTGKYGETVIASFTRDSGEDVGTYQIWMYDLATLSLNKGSGDGGFADGYKAACKTKFETENPNYTLSLTYTQGQTGNYTIKPRTLGSSGSLNEKAYDGTATAVINIITPVTSILPADLGSGVLAAIDAHFDSANVKRDESGVVAKQDGEVIVTLTGDKVKNYALPNGYESGKEKDNITWTVNGEGDETTITMKRDGLSAKINPITLVYATAAKSKVYDGTAVAPFDSAMLTKLIPADQENVGTLSAVFEDKNVGDAKVFTLVSAENKIVLTNYIDPNTFTANITPAPLSVTGLTAEGKVYDGTIAAVLSGTPAIDASGKIGQDDVSVAEQVGELTGEFYDKNVGNKKSVIVSAGFGLTGADAGNYYLKPADTLQANITPATLTVTPDTEQYKSIGALDPAFTYTLTGLQGEDTASVVRGALSRPEGETEGEYAYTLGSLTANSNYTLVLAEDAPKFTIRNTDATLSALTVSGGTLTPAFSAEVESYTVKLPHGTTAVPTVNATANDSDAAVVMTPAENLSGSTTILVTAADGATTKTYTVSFAVAEVVSITATVVNATSGSSDGMIIAAGAGGSGSYEYKLGDGAWQTSNTFSGKAAGSYTLHVRDAGDPANTVNVSATVGTNSGATVAAPSTLTANPANPVIPHSAGRLEIALTAGGVDGATYVYFVDEAGTTGATISGSTLTIANVGTVTVSAKAVKDGAISAAKTLALTIAKAATVTITKAVTDATVYGGTNGKIAVTAAGGFGTYEYRLNSGAWQPGATFTGLKAGAYQVSVRDAEDIANIVTESVSVGQAQATDAAAISAVLERLTLGDTTAVTESLTLPVSDSYGGKDVAISWTTSNASVVGADGTVTRPSNSTGDQTVTLTATLTLNGITRTKAFAITVVKKSASSGGDSSSGGISGSGDNVSISAGNGTVSGSQMERAVDRADEGATIDIKATGSTDATLPLSGLSAAADNGNTLAVTTQNGEIALSAEALKGLAEGADSGAKATVGISSASAADAGVPTGTPVFDVSVSVGGQAVHSFDGALDITLTVSNLSKIENPYVLHVLNDGTKQYLKPTVSGNQLTVSGVTNLSYFAVIPGSAVPEKLPFTDVSQRDYFYDAVLWAVGKDITGGTSATTFSPNLVCTRAQAVTFLWRAAGSPTATGNNPFTDVDSGAYYHNAVLWAVEKGITSGTSATTFDPDATCTRGQIATFLYRYAGSSTVLTGNPFTDVAADDYCANAVAWAAAENITSGTSATTFAPGADCTRGQIVTFLYRYMGK